jgi:hypothetical protein
MMIMKPTTALFAFALALATCSANAGKVKKATAVSRQSVEDAWKSLVDPLPAHDSCDNECRSICCKNGGKNACVTACGCPAGSCPKAVSKPLTCEKECRSICCKNGGKDACVTACGAPLLSLPLPDTVSREEYMYM